MTDQVSTESNLCIIEVKFYFFNYNAVQYLHKYSYFNISQIPISDCGDRSNYKDVGDDLHAMIPVESFDECRSLCQGVDACVRGSTLFRNYDSLYCSLKAVEGQETYESNTRIVNKFCGKRNQIVIL